MAIPNYYDSLFTPEQMSDIRYQGISQGLLGLGQALSQAGAPSLMPQGDGLSQGLAAFNQGYQGSMDRALQDMLKGAQVKQMLDKQKQEANIQRIKQQAVTPVAEVAPSMTSQTPYIQNMMKENMLLGDTNLESLSRSGNYAVQGTGKEVAPSVSQMFDQNKLMRDLYAAGYADEAKKYAPEYLTVGDSVYIKDPIKGLTQAIDNTGKLTGEFGNLAKLMYGTDVVSKLPQGASQTIIGQVNKGKALTGGIGMEVGKEGSNILDKELIDMGTNRMRFTQAQQLARPEFFTRPFQIQMQVAKEKEKLNSPLSETERKNLSDYTAFTQTGMESLNAYINKITGAAMGAGDEEKRLRSAMPDPQKDSYTEFMSKTENVLKQGKLIEARYAYVKKNGLKFESVPVTSMPAIMRAREAAIIKELNLDPSKPADYDAIKARLAQEFGLLQ
jgi:hypothetical protein